MRIKYAPSDTLCIAMETTQSGSRRVAGAGLSCGTNRSERFVLALAFTAGIAQEALK